jgi:hypothetical protein
MNWDWDRKTTIAAGLGAAIATGATVVGVLVGRRYWRGEGVQSAPAIVGDRPAGPVGHSGNARNAGAEDMRDPPKEWSRTDQAVDESFPASDPATAPHID